MTRDFSTKYVRVSDVPEVLGAICDDREEQFREGSAYQHWPPVPRDNIATRDEWGQMAAWRFRRY